MGNESRDISKQDQHNRRAQADTGTQRAGCGSQQRPAQREQKKDPPHQPAPGARRESDPQDSTDQSIDRKQAPQR